MKVIEFIIENWDLLLLIILSITAFIVAIFKGNKSVVMKMLDSLVTEAEKNLGGGTGSLKLSTVITEIYPKLPVIIKTFITADTLIKWIEEALDIAKQKWRDNANIKAYIEPDTTTDIVALEVDTKPPDEKATE